ncbi:hypothetical protein NST64_03375 [Staphylococcus sp. FSL W8-1268]|uniref:hypothetical protein n=1 Tax=Staphylococcus sp. FSL W8-1268 TaxID=2954651 RepID=UPI0030F66587
MAKLHFGSKEYFEKQSEFWFKENSKHISERDAYKKQRDELINDIADIKRKAEAFDEIKVNLYHVKDLKPWETLDPKDHEFLRDIFNEIPSDWEADH